jgi:hypothetical protein
MALQGPLKGRTHRYLNAGTETMISQKGFCRAEGGFLQAATGAAALIVAAICATPWAGSARHLVAQRPANGTAE